MHRAELSLVEFAVAHEDAALVEEMLLGQGFSPTLKMQPDSTASVEFRIFAEEESGMSAAELAARLSELFTGWNRWLNQAVDCFQPMTMQREDWAESWKQHFKSLRIGGRLVIRPEWETVKAKPGERVVVLNPGMSFGTGNHGTTRGCLEMIEYLQRRLGAGASLLDAGCGSGILSMAAVALGYQPVRAFDNDAESVRIAGDNLRLAGLAKRVKLDRADLRTFTETSKYRVVAANILASVLRKNAKKLIALLDNDSTPAYLIVSGILEEQYEGVKKVFLELGLTELANRLIEGWKTGCFCCGKSQPS